MTNWRYIVGDALLIGTLLLKLPMIIWRWPSGWWAYIGVPLLFFISGVVLWGDSSAWVPFVLGFIEILSVVVLRARDARKAAAK